MIYYRSIKDKMGMFWENGEILAAQDCLEK